MVAADAAHAVAVPGFPGEVKRHLRLAPHRAEWIVPKEKACHRLEHTVTGEGQITRLNRGANGHPIEVDRGGDRLRPEGNYSHRVVDPRLVGDEAVLLDQVAGEFGETLAIAVTVKDRSEHSPQIAIGVCGSAARPVLHADLHHAAQMQTAQTEVAKIGAGSKHPQELHSGL